MHWMNSMNNCVQEDCGLMRQFIIIFMAPHLRNSLSYHVKIDMILCVDYMITTKIKKIPLVQHICMVVILYRKIQMLILLFIFVLL